MPTDTLRPRLTFYADFTCPFSYVAWRALVPQARDEVAFDLEWRPFELDPDLPADGRLIPRQDAGRIWGSTRRLAERHGVPVSRQAPERTPNSRPALQAAEAARAAGTLLPFVEAVLDAWFLHGKDISDPNVLTGLAPELNLADPQWAEALTEARRTAQAAGVSSVPAFRVGERLLHGIVDPGDLADFIAGR